MARLDDTVLRPLRAACIVHPDRVLLLPLDAGACLPVELDGNGRQIWEAIESGTTTMSDLVQGLAEQNGWEADELADGISSFVDSLVTVGLVQYEPRGAPVVQP